MLSHSLLKSKAVTVGEFTLIFDAYERNSAEVHLVVCDRTKPFLKRLTLVTLKDHESHSLPNGVVLTLRPGATQKRLFLKFDNSSNIPIWAGWHYENQERSKRRCITDA
jgi:hypothetical protein